MGICLTACVVEMEYTCGLSPHAIWIEGSTPSASIPKTVKHLHSAVAQVETIYTCDC